MKPQFFPLLAIAASLTLNAQLLTHEHVDLGVAYEGGALEPHWHDETHDIEYTPDGATVQLGGNTLTTIPANSAFSFLGNPGDPLWLLPAVQDPAKVFLGIAAEEIEAGIFQGNVVQLSLTAVSGPGSFFAYSVNGFGVPNPFWNSRNGVDAADTVNAVAGGHTDYNWAFTAPGDYVVSVQATGTRVADGMVVTSEVGHFQFAVVPEPEAYVALAGAALVVFGIWRRHARR